MVLAGQCEVFPIWESISSCNATNCIINAEFPPIHFNCELKTFYTNETVANLQYTDVFNDIVMRKLYDIPDVVITSTATDTPFPGIAGMYTRFVPSGYGVFEVSSIVPKIRSIIGNKTVDLSEVDETSFDGQTWVPRSITFNATKHRLGDKLLIAYGFNNDHVVMKCPLNSIGEFNQTTGKFKVLRDGTYEIHSTANTSVVNGLTTVKRSIRALALAENSIFKMPLFTFATNISTVEQFTDCNLTKIECDLFAHQECNVLFRYGHFENDFNLTWIGRLPLLSEVFHLNGVVYTIGKCDSVDDDVSYNMNVPAMLGEISAISHQINHNVSCETSTCSYIICATQYPFTESCSSTQVASSGHSVAVVSLTSTFVDEMSTTELFDKNFNGTTSGDYIYPSLVGNVTIEGGAMHIGSGNATACWQLPKMNWISPRIGFEMLAIRDSPTTTTARVLAYPNATTTALSPISAYNIAFDGVWHNVSASVAGWPNDFRVCFETQGNATILLKEIRYYDQNKSSSDWGGLQNVTFSVRPVNNETIGWLSIYDVVSTYLLDGGVNFYYDNIGNLSACSLIPFGAKGSTEIGVLGFREMKNKGNISLHNAMFGEHLADFDPDFIAYGEFVIENPNITTCSKIKSMSTDQKTKDTVEITVRVTNDCLLENTTVYIVPDDDYFVVDTKACTKFSTDFKCKFTIQLLSESDFPLTSVAVSGNTDYMKIAVRYDWNENCWMLCNLPYVRDWPEWIKFMLVSTMVVAMFVFMLYLITPFLYFFAFLMRTSMFGAWLLVMIFWPFKRIWDSAVYNCKRLYRWQSERFRKLKEEQSRPDANRSETRSNRYEMTQVVIDNSNVKNIGKSKVIFMIGILFMSSVFEVPRAFGCEFESLQASNISTCFEDKCTTKLNIGYTLPSTKDSELCLMFSSVETNIGDQVIPIHSLNVTTLDFYAEYPMDFQYLSPWDTNFLTKSSCECPDGSHHACSSSDHHSSISCSIGNYCFYKSHSGLGDDCELQFMFGDGHYCTSFDLRYTDEVSVSSFTGQIKYHMRLAVCKDDYNGPFCETFWHNSTEKATYSLFDSSVSLIINGYLLNSLPSLSGYSFIRSRSKSWIYTGINARGDYTLGTPGFVQFYPEQNGNWSLNTNFMSDAISWKDQYCWDTNGNTRTTVSMKYELWNGYLADSHVSEKWLGQYGRVVTTGYGSSSSLKIYPVQGADTLQQIITKENFFSVEVDNACPEIIKVSTENVFLDSSHSSISIFAHSTCDSGEVKMFLENTTGIESYDTLDIIINSDISEYPLGLKPTKDSIAGFACVESFFNKECMKFNFNVSQDDQTDGQIVDSQTDVNSDGADDECWLCWGDWTSASLGWGGLTNIFISIVRIVVYVILGFLGLILIGVILKLTITVGLPFLIKSGKSGKDN